MDKLENTDKFYEINIGGLKRKLRLCKVNETTSIAAFILFSDVEMTEKCAELLLKKAEDFDVILCPEAKGIPLAYELARRSKKPYFIARKSVKVYMPSPVMSRVKSITTLSEQYLFLDKSELDFMHGKRVLIVDDVISTGSTLDALAQLLESSGTTVVGKAAVFAEGDAASRTDIICLDTLPLFKN